MFEFTTLFCTIDDFFQKNEAIYWQYLKKKTQSSDGGLVFYASLKLYLLRFGIKNHNSIISKPFIACYNAFIPNFFKTLLSYQRIIHLINQHQLALQTLHISLTSRVQTECAWVDSTTLPVCKNQRIQRHQSLKEIATRGKSSMGWFYGCKLHVLVDAKGHFIQIQLSNGHTSDIKMLPNGLPPLS